MRAFFKYVVMTLYLGFVHLRNLVYRFMNKSPITVLAYHRVDDDPTDVNAVSPAIFERQMVYLKSNYRIISVAELLAVLRAGKNTERSVVITFDDGYRDNCREAAPILKKHDIPACFFLSTGFIDTNRFFPHDLKRLGHGVPSLSWEEVIALAGQGFEIGSHTVNHLRISECDEDTLAREIADSREILERKTGRDVRYFSFPFGKATDFSESAVKLLKKFGYSCNFSAFGGQVLPADNPFYLKRQGVSNHPSLLFFKAWVEGWKVRSY